MVQYSVLSPQRAAVSQRSHSSDCALVDHSEMNASELFKLKWNYEPYVGEWFHCRVKNVFSKCCHCLFFVCKFQTIFSVEVSWRLVCKRRRKKKKHHRQVISIVFTLLENTRTLDTSRHTKSIQNCSWLYRIIKIIILFVYSNGRKTKPNQKFKMKCIVTGIRYIQEYCLFFSFDCCCKGVITFSCLPGSSQRMLPLLQYFNLHGGDKASAAGRKKKLQKKKKREPSTWN